MGFDRGEVVWVGIQEPVPWEGRSDATRSGWGGIGFRLAPLGLWRDGGVPNGGVVHGARDFREAVPLALIVLVLVLETT